MGSDRLAQLFRILPAVLALTAAAQPLEPDLYLANYGCDDVVLIGRVVRQRETSSGAGEWYGKIEMDIAVERVLRGSETRPQVSAWVVAHAKLNPKMKFLFVLKPQGDGTYWNRSGWVIFKDGLNSLGQPARNPRLAEHCVPESMLERG